MNLIDINKYFFLNLLKKKFIIFHILRFIFFRINNKKIKKNNLFFFYKHFYFFFIFLFIENKKKLPTINQFYLIKFYNIINQKLFSNHFNVNYFNSMNAYFFWSFFNKDLLIKLLMNLIMKKGQKYTSYKIIYNTLFYMKKLTGLQPFFILKKSLYQNRLLFDIQYLHLKKKIITMPKLLSVKSQLSKSLKYIFNSFILNTFSLSKKKKYLSFYKKISYILLNHLFYNNRLKKLIKKEKFTVKNNFFHITKESFLSKYLHEMDNSKIYNKVRLFKIKFKSLSKKDKILKEKNKRFFEVKKQINVMKLFIFNKYRLNLQSKLKLKSKWF